MRSRRASGPSSPQGDLGFALGDHAPEGPDDARPRRAAATPGATPESAVAISTITQTAKAVLEGAFQPLWIRGEVSNFTAHRNGHWYFTLKDQESQLRCVVWSRDNARLPAAPDDGMEVAAYGRLSMYVARGEIQFVITRLEAAGEGLWRKAFEQVRKRLEADGLLRDDRKRPLPVAPRRIACITSATGAAFHDIVAVTRRRAPATELVLVPAQVQGEGAPESLIHALDQVTRWGDCDLVIIGRGGGSREDLWCFNDEALCRAVAAFPIPIVSAVGHEVDVSLCDLVADWRAPTPSAAAERAVPDHLALVAHVRALGLQLRATLERRARRGRQALLQTGRHLSRSARALTDRARARTAHAAARLDALSPLATLARGYAVARAADGTALTSIESFHPGLAFRVVLRDGEVAATAGELHPGAPDGVPGRSAAS